MIYSDDNTPRRPPARNARVGLYARGWREGFTCGAVDLARVASREIDDPHVWAVLDRIAQQYQLARGR